MLDTGVVLIFFAFWLYLIIFLAKSDSIVENEHRFINKSDVFGLFDFRLQDIEFNYLKRIKKIATFISVIAIFFFILAIVYEDSLPASVNFFNDFILLLIPILLILHLSYLYKRSFEVKTNTFPTKNFYRTFFLSYKHIPANQKLSLLAVDVISLISAVAILIYR